MCTPYQQCNTILYRRKYRHAGTQSVPPPYSSSVELSMRALRTVPNGTDLVRCLQVLTCAPSTHSLHPSLYSFGAQCVGFFSLGRDPAQRAMSRCFLSLLLSSLHCRRHWSLCACLLMCHGQSLFSKRLPLTLRRGNTGDSKAAGPFSFEDF